MTGRTDPPPDRDVAASWNLHATCLVLGENGILIRGPSGSGKTRLALALVAEAAREGSFARLVSDDRTLVVPRCGRLVARPHRRIAGLAERRGIGVVPIEHEAACRLALAVDLAAGDWPPRLPEREDRMVILAGVTLPRLAVGSCATAAEAVALVLDALAALTTSS